MPIFQLYSVCSCLLAVVAIQKEMSVRWRIGASIQVFLAASCAVVCAGIHMCDEGGSPLFVTLTVGALAAVIPWFRRWNVWVLRICMIALLMVGMRTASLLTNTYHGDAITGNPEFSSGRFWHTPFTGQYPRDQSRPRERMRTPPDKPEAN